MRHRVLILAAWLPILWLSGCAGGVEGYDGGGVYRVEVGGGLLDLGPAPDVAGAPDMGSPEVFVPRPPECPPGDGPWQLYFTRSVEPAVAPAAPAACGDVRLDLAFADWLREARDSVDVASYSLASQEVADALKSLHYDGVDVRVIVDDEKRYDNGSRIGQLESAGIVVRDDAPAEALMHHKFAVRDGNDVWFGSANATYYDGLASANNMMAIRAPSFATALSDEFERLWNGGFHADPKAPMVGLQLDGHAAELYLAPSDAIEPALRGLIAGAQHEIFVSMFAFTRDGLADALTSRCGEVDVFVVLDETTTEDGYTVTLDGCASIDVRLDAVTPAEGFSWALLHHKVMVVDGLHPDGAPAVVTGSLNWSRNGLERNDEALLIWHHPVVAAQFSQEFAARLVEAGGQLP